MMLLCSIHCSALPPAEKHRKSIVLLLIIECPRTTDFMSLCTYPFRSWHSCQALPHIGQIDNSHNGSILARGNDLKPLTMYT